LVREQELDALASGLDWLEAHRPVSPTALSILHLDFHPLNVMVHEGRPVAVLDWGEADVGDRHADVATTLLLMDSAPVVLARPSERLLAPAARWILKRRYLRQYAGQLPLDPELLRYYLAWASLRRLATYGTWQRAGPQACGYKSGTLCYVTPSHLDALRRRFHRSSGISVAPN
jgi:aminoglycoside phosphotransferase (APT) family kinase protein